MHNLFAFYFLRLPPYQGREINSELKKTKRLFEAEIKGPEAFTVDKDGQSMIRTHLYLHSGVTVLVSLYLHDLFVWYCAGNLYTGLGDGRVVRFTDTQVETVVRLGQPPYDQCGEHYVQTKKFFFDSILCVNELLTYTRMILVM